MTSKEVRAAQQLLELPAAEYYSFDEDKELELLKALGALTPGDELPGQNGSAPSPVLALGAPGRVDLDKGAVVPLLVGYQQTGLRAWEVNYETNLHLFVKELATGELRIAQPFMDMRRGQLYQRSGAGDPPDDLNARTVHSAVTRIDLRKKMEGGLKPGRYRITAAAYDLLSNSVAMHLESASQAEPAFAGKFPQAYVKPSLIKTSPLKTSIEVPAKATMGRPAFLEVAIQVGKADGVHTADSGESYWTCHLILIRLDERPTIVPVTVPVQAVAAPDGQPAYNAAFQIDLNAVIQSKTAGTYQIYMDMGSDVLGPFALAFEVD
jgi:hypothetical protein